MHHAPPFGLNRIFITRGIRTNRIALALATALLAIPAAHAQDKPLDDSWSGTGEAGLAIAKGNTDSRTLVGKLAAKKAIGEWKVGAGAAFLNGKADGVESAYRYEVFGDVARSLSDRSYVVGSLRNERDHFAANEYQWVASAGYGYEAIKNERTQLLFEVGPGYRWSKLQGVRVHNNEAILRGLMGFKHQLNENVSLYDTLLVETGKSNTFARNDAGVLVKMTEAMALKAGIEHRYNSDVPVGIKKLDTLTTVNVVYGF